jgi:plastocyanin
MTDRGSVRRLSSLGAGLGTVLILLAACASTASSSSTASESAAASESTVASSSESAEAPTVTITGTTSFGADEITVPAGQTLTVTNSSSFPHTFTEGEDGVKADNARVNETIDPDASVEIEFPEPGDYNITCLIHSGMNMVVHVE